MFISAVTSELGAYRSRLALELRRRGTEVKVQEDFPQGSGTLLDKLKDYIDHCDAVICLIGDAYGVEPPGAITLGSQRRSYTQWEFQFASDRNKKNGMPLYVYIKKENVNVGKPFVQSEEEANIQKQFRKEVLSTGLDYGPIESEDKLAVHVLHHDWTPGSQTRSRWWRIAISLIFLSTIASIALWKPSLFSNLRNLKPSVSGHVANTQEAEIQQKVFDYLGQPQKVIDTPHPERQIINDLDQPNNDGFVVIMRELVWDTREWKPVMEDVIGPEGSALTLYSKSRIRKIELNDLYTIAPKTNGTELFVRPSLNFPFTVYAIREPKIVGGILE